MPDIFTSFPQMKDPKNALTQQIHKYSPASQKPRAENCRPSHLLEKNLAGLDFRGQKIWIAGLGKTSETSENQKEGKARKYI